MHRRTPIRALAACGLSLALVACGGGDDEEPTDDSTTTSTTEAAEDEATTTTTEAPEDEATTTTVQGNAGSDLTPEEIAEAMRPWLLSLEEIGDPEAEEVPYATSEGPNPCGNDVDAEAPYVAIAGRQVQNGSRQVLFLEEIRLYDTPAEAAEVFDLAIESLDCGTSEDGSATIEGPIDIVEEVGGDAAVGFGFEGDQIDGSLFLILYSDTILRFQFQSGPESVTEGLPNPVDIAASGLEKLVNEIG